ncbi:MAG TPA: hypothetical protein VEG60_05380, partial [Candidatus Binatia bacterium]|nr:hypothetical protein [Candidatus Binatia bacterium]
MDSTVFIYRGVSVLDLFTNTARNFIGMKALTRRDENDSPDRLFLQVTNSRGRVFRTDMYAKHFGLVEPPFSVTPDPRFSYSNSLYREAFATLRYGIETRKGFIVITGEAGT